MPRRTRLYISILSTLGICLALGLLFSNTIKNNHKMTQNENRLLLTSALIVDRHANQKKIVDHNKKTAILNLNHLQTNNITTFPVSSSKKQLWPFRLDVPFVQLDVGLSHFPGRPPIINPLQSIKIWPGNQKTRQTWQATGRPKHVLFIFFRQRLVDADREYKLIGEPVLWQTFKFKLKNEFGSQKLPLEFKNKILPSEDFPGQIDFIWCRLEIQSYYLGNDPNTKNNIAISEIEFYFKNKYRKRITNF